MMTPKNILRFSFVLGWAWVGLAAGGGPTDFPSLVSSLGPVGYWRFSATNPVPAEVAAVNLGALGAAFNGEYQAMPSRGLAGAIVGDANTAAAFDGGSQRVVVPFAASYNPNGAFSVEAWLKPGTANPGALSAPLNAAHMAAPRSGWLLYQNGDAGWSFRLYNQNGTAFSLELVGGESAVDTWYHIVAVYDGADATLYVNGVPVATGTPSGTPRAFVPNVDGNFTMGARSDFAYAWKGTADEVAIYTTALSPGVISAHYENGLNPNRGQAYNALVLASNPALYYRLGEAPLTLPVTRNLGTWGSAADGVYLPGSTPAVSGPQRPAFAGFDSDNRAVRFNGTNGLVRVPGQPLVTDTATFLCWLRREGDQPTRAGIMHHRSVPNNVRATGLGLQDAGNALSYNWEDAGETYNFNPGFVLPDRGWAMVAVSVKPDYAVLYMGSAAGLQAATNSWTHPPHDFSGAAIEFGIDNYQATRVFRGAIDEFAIFDRALEPEEISSLFYMALPAITLAKRTPDDPIYEGMSVTFTAAVASRTSVTYQWVKNGVELQGKTTSTLVLDDVQRGDSGDYTLMVVAGGVVLTSPILPLNVQSGPPILTKAPTSAVRFPNGKVTFSTAAMGSKPITWQWRHGQQSIPGATGSDLTIDDVQAADAGTYTAVITNPYGSVETSATLQVSVPTLFAAAATDAGPIGYWRLNESSGTIANDYWGGRDGARRGGVTLSTAGPALPGFPAGNPAYRFDGSSGVVAIPPLNLNKATMTILAFINPPVTPGGIQGIVFSRAGSTVAGLNLDSGNLRYHWNDAGNTWGWDSTLTPEVGRWNFVALVVEPTQAMMYLDTGTGLGFAVNEVSHGLEEFDGTLYLGQDATGGRFFNGGLDEVVIYDRALAASEIEALRNAAFNGAYTGPVRPQIVLQPKSQTIEAGTAYALVAKASGSLPLSYQWQKNNVDLPGATRSVLNFPSAYYPDSGTYRLVVNNSAGTATSGPATLTVLPPPTSINLSQDLVVHLKFDGNLTDSSGRGNHGAAMGSPTFVAGKIGTRALHYNTDTGAGIYNYVTLGAPADLMFDGNVNWSVALWTRFTGSPGDLPFLCNNMDSYGGAGYVFAPSWQTGSWSWSLNDGTSPAGWPGYASQYGNEAGYPNALNDGNWHHLVYTVDRTDEVVTYMDGVRVHAKPIAGLAFDVDTGLPVNIGQGANGDYGVSGAFDMDDLGVWRRALTLYEAQAIYKVAQRGLTFDAPGSVQLTVQRTASGLDLVWPGGQLESAEFVNGPYTPVVGAVAPFYQLVPSGKARFYQVRQ